MNIKKNLVFPFIPWSVRIEATSTDGTYYTADVVAFLPGLGVCTLHSWQSYNLIEPAMSELDFQNRVNEFADQAQAWTREELCTNILSALECGHYRNRGVENEATILADIRYVIDNIMADYENAMVG